tara:strand:+ start:170 stop:631 length:462 start_codon:yes stop_codon:yes gene_type:complete
MKILFKISILLFFLANIAKADLIKPSSDLKPLDVLMIQLNSLKDNNNPYKDAGIAQSWEFAHPINKASTGPLENFTQMIYADSYNILISHINNKVTTLKESENQLVYKVYVLSKDKEKYYYIWQIEKIEKEGKLKDCWMTTSVSRPTYLGKII